MSYYILVIAKALAAVVTVIIGSGILTGHWTTDAELLLSAITGFTVWLTPNAGRVTPPVVTRGDTV